MSGLIIRDPALQITPEELLIDPRNFVFPSQQTQRVYSWEEHVFTDCYLSYLTLDECREIVTTLWSKLGFVQASPQVFDGRGAGYARAKECHELHLPQWARNYTVLAHELAHCVMDPINSNDSLDHGGMFMHTYLYLLTLVTNHRYTDLEASVRAHGLRINRFNLLNYITKLNESTD